MNEGGKEGRKEEEGRRERRRKGNLEEGRRKMEMKGGEEWEGRKEGKRMGRKEGRKRGKRKEKGGKQEEQKKKERKKNKDVPSHLIGGNPESGLTIRSYDRAPQSYLRETHIRSPNIHPLGHMILCWSRTACIQGNPRLRKGTDRLPFLPSLTHRASWVNPPASYPQWGSHPRNPLGWKPKR
ncbi:Protein SREK1IP1, partial [Ophiophagus hannah]